MDVLKVPSSLIFHSTCPHGIGCNSQLVDHTRNFTCNKDNTMGLATLCLRAQCQVGQATLRNCHVMPKVQETTKGKKMVFKKNLKITYQYIIIIMMRKKKNNNKERELMSCDVMMINLAIKISLFFFFCIKGVSVDAITGN